MPDRTTMVTITLDPDQPEHLLFQELTGRVMSGIYAIPPQDRRDTIIVMHPDMRNLLERNVPWREPVAPPLERVDPVKELTQAPPVDRLFGHPLETWPLPEWTTVEIWAENAYDRALRRAQERHQPVIVWTGPELSPADYALPTPTLKALVRHWTRKLRRKGHS